MSTTITMLVTDKDETVLLGEHEGDYSEYRNDEWRSPLAVDHPFIVQDFINNLVLSDTEDKVVLFSRCDEGEELVERYQISWTGAKWGFNPASTQF